jgi:hypothetical protein
MPLQASDRQKTPASAKVGVFVLFRLHLSTRIFRRLRLILASRFFDFFRELLAIASSFGVFRHPSERFRRAVLVRGLAFPYALLRLHQRIFNYARKESP